MHIAGCKLHLMYTKRYHWTKTLELPSSTCEKTEVIAVSLILIHLKVAGLDAETGRTALKACFSKCPVLLQG